MTSQQQLFARYARAIGPGSLEWIGLRPRHKEAMAVVGEVLALEGLGLEGDHRCGKKPGSARQVTLISREFIGQIAHFTGRETIDPALLRRNLVISGINLWALRYQRFTIGQAVFEATALCHPCSRMDQALGDGGLVAMLGHGGLCAKILGSGRIAIGDEVKVLVPA
ncbi:MAG: MOSC domain-containing protein [Halieaceae bacterium]|jgi:MOSC domain-containing protein YiiM|nr:MOSC domain-containing protein [Halieaceae bacterium]